jgi:hypothetical protein
MSEQSTRQAHEQADYRGERVHVNGTVLVGRPATIVPKGKPQPENFTKEAFEGALDKVSRPLKGRFAHVPYSSEDLIRDKRVEVELEDRPS